MKINKSLVLIMMASALSLVACNNASSSTQAPQSNPDTSSVEDSSKAPSGATGEFEIVTDLSEPFEIHTAAQKAYLDYDGAYDKIDPNKYPDGQQHLSDPEPVKLEWEHEPDEDKTLKSYSVVYGKEADLSDGYEIKGTKNTKLDVYNSYIGINYFKVVANYSDNTSDESDIYEYEVAATGPRNLKVDGMTNCRDIGGRTTENGAVIKQGLVYRTSGNNYNMRGAQISSAGIEEMTGHWKVKTEINVNDSSSYNVSLPGVTIKDCLMNYGGSASHHFSRNTESVKNFFKLLADDSNYPVFFHCRIGTDRTGLCANLLGGLLGIPLNDIYQDYLFSNFGQIGEKRYIGTQAGQDNIENYMKEVNALPGATFQNKTYNALLSIGLSRETLDAVINNLTDGAKPNDNNGQISNTADKLTLNGVSLSTSTTRDHPASYVTLNSTSKSVSMTFTAEATGQAKIVAYLGNTEHSTSKKIGDAIKVQYDGANVTVPTITYSDACMGNVSNRMNYYFVDIGTINLTAGQHTITVTGTSNTMNLGALSVLPL